jgi:hypothetical protein
MNELLLVSAKLLSGVINIMPKINKIDEKDA